MPRPNTPWLLSLSLLSSILLQPPHVPELQLTTVYNVQLEWHNPLWTGWALYVYCDGQGVMLSCFHETLINLASSKHHDRNHHGDKRKFNRPLLLPAPCTAATAPSNSTL